MAILYQQNFDGVATGALAGWVNGSGSSFVVGTTHPISGTQSFGENVFTDGHTAVYTGISAQADQCIQVTQRVNISANNGAAMGLSLRTDAAANTTGYYFLPNFPANGGTPAQAYIFKRVGGGFTMLDVTNMGLSFVDGDVAFFKAEVSGTTIRWKVWKGGTGEPASWTKSITDSSISAAGYAGLRTGAENGGNGGFTSQVDDLYIGDAGQNFTMTASLSGNTVTLTGFSNGWTAGTPGTPTFTINGGNTITSQTVSGTNAATVTLSQASAPTTIVDPNNQQGVQVITGASIAPNNAGLFYSPYNWFASGSSYAKTVNVGAYIKTTFSGSYCDVNVDMSPLSGASVAAKKYPRVRYRIDGGSWTTYQFVASDTKINVATGISTGNHLLEFWLQASDGNDTDRWNTPVSCLTVTGLLLDNGATVSLPSLKPKRAIWFGDSITEGAWVDGDHSDLTNYSLFEEHLSSYPKILSDYLNAEYGDCAFGNQGWERQGNLNVPKFSSAYSFYFSTNSRLTGGLFTPTPDYLFVNMGTNDGGTADATITADVTAMMTSLRTAAGASCQIYIFVPFNQTKASAVTAGFNNYVSGAPSDTKVTLIDLGSNGVTWSTSVPTDSADGLHPNPTGHQNLATGIKPSLPTPPSPSSSGMGLSISLCIGLG